jgi:Protein of unknown function (DUF3040).
VLEDEQRALQELERGLAADDPAFVETFRRRQSRLANARGHRGVRIAALVVAAICVVLVLVGSPAGAIAVAGTAAAVWLTWRFADDIDPQAHP